MLNLDQAKVITLIRDSVGPAIQKARGMARRAASASYIRSILAALNMWAADHQGAFPPDLQALIHDKLTGPMILVNPSRSELGQPSCGPAGPVRLPGRTPGGHSSRSCGEAGVGASGATAATP